MTRSFLIPVILLLFCSTATAVDLYKVLVDNQEDARRLEGCGVDAALKLSDGYLVLIKADDTRRLAQSELSIELIAAGVSREELALDIRHDDSNRGRFHAIYEKDGLRLFRIDPTLLGPQDELPGLAWLGETSLPIFYSESRTLHMDRLDEAPDLDSLISLIEQDSLESYAHMLESFYRRVTGTSGAYICRNWILDKLSQFGYDSVVIDSFVANIYGTDKKCHNVVAYKVGTMFPLHQIVIGAHRDAALGSPGADDDGSGTCGVLEIARAMRDIDTRLTFVFILFDAEEQGLLGSWHFAATAAQERDSIVLMLNIDMIANLDNDSNAVIFHGLDTSYSVLWAQLADSLASINLTTQFHPGSAGDDLAFEQYGYNTIGVHEYVFSPYYHTCQDSTTYLNYDYETRMTRATLATACAVDAIYPVGPMVAFGYPNGVPPMIYPGITTSVQVELHGYAGDELVPGSGQLHYCVNGGDIVSIELTSLGGDLFEGTLPPMERLNQVEFYFSAEGVSGGIVYDPQPSSPFAAAVATRVTTVFYDDFQTDLGWAVTGSAISGHFSREMPEYTFGWWGSPADDYDHSGLCYLNDRGIGCDIDGGYTILTSPAVDLSNGNAVIEYARWYSNDQAAAPHSDIMQIYISNNDGQNWMQVETLGPVENASGGWFLHSFWADQFSANTQAVRLRFVASDLGEDSHVEAAVDAVKVTLYTCDPLVITEQLPDAQFGETYSQSLVAVGGEGELNWSDRYDDLSATGLMLTVEGLLTGIPTATGDVTFTAHAEDAAGEYDERQFTFRIWAVFICGDIDNSGADPDIGDLVYLVDYMFNAGPPPPVVEAADVNASGGDLDIADLVYLVDYMFTGGPPPVCP